MDEADRDIEMEEDPFLAAGIDIPKELPYISPKPRHKNSLHKNDQTEVNIGKKSSTFSNTSNRSNVEQNINIQSNNGKKSIPEFSFEPPTPTSLPPNNANFNSTAEPKDEI